MGISLLLWALLWTFQWSHRTCWSFQRTLTHGIRLLLDATSFNRHAHGGLGDIATSWPAVREARQYLSAAFRLNPENADASTALAVALVGFGREFDHELVKNLTQVHSSEEVLTVSLRCISGGLEVGAMHKVWKERQGTSRQLPPEMLLVIGHRYGIGYIKDPQLLHYKTRAEGAFREALRLRPQSRWIVGEATEGLRRLGHDAESHEIILKAVADGLWHHPLQRPRHYFWPGMRSSPVPDRGSALENRCSSCRKAREILEAALKQHRVEMQQEALEARRLLAKRSSKAIGTVVHSCVRNGTCLTVSPGRIRSLPAEALGRWAIYLVHHRLTKTSGTCYGDRFPQACAAISRMIDNGLPIVGLSITEVNPPRTFIPRHSSHPGKLRLWCPLQIPDDSVSRLVFRGYDELVWSADNNEQCVWFDESFEHELHYEGSVTRFSYLLDIPHPDLLQSEDSSWPLEELHLESPYDPFDLLRRPFAALAAKFGVQASRVSGLWPEHRGL